MSFNIGRPGLDESASIALGAAKERGLQISATQLED